MQSWGTQSRFSTRDTGLEPSKSGVIGLLCAALGLGRDSPLDDLARLRMGVRVDRAGVMEKDYQTAGGGTLPGGRAYGVHRANDARGQTVLSNRYYLADADFLVGLESDDAALLRRLDRRCGLRYGSSTWGERPSSRACPSTSRMGSARESIWKMLCADIPGPGAPWMSGGPAGGPTGCG